MAPEKNKNFLACTPKSYEMAPGNPSWRLCSPLAVGTHNILVMYLLLWYPCIDTKLILEPIIYYLQRIIFLMHPCIFDPYWYISSHYIPPKLNSFCEKIMKMLNSRIFFICIRSICVILFLRKITFHNCSTFIYEQKLCEKINKKAEKKTIFVKNHSIATS